MLYYVICHIFSHVLSIVIHISQIASASANAFVPRLPRELRPAPLARRLAASSAISAPRPANFKASDSSACRWKTHLHGVCGVCGRISERNGEPKNHWRTMKRETRQSWREKPWNSQASLSDTNPHGPRLTCHCHPCLRTRRGWSSLLRWSCK